MPSWSVSPVLRRTKRACEHKPFFYFVDVEVGRIDGAWLSGEDISVGILSRRVLPGSIGMAWRLIAAILVLSVPLRAGAQGDVDPDRQALILVRALAYDNNLRTRAGDAVVLAVVSRGGNAASEAAAQDMLKAFRSLERIKVQQLPFRAVMLPYPGKAALKSAVTAQGIDVLYICGGLESELSAIKEFSRHEHLLTIGAKPEFVENGLSLGVFIIESKNTITVNLGASREEGAAFGADLLRVGRVIR
jgi:hypothetical protein